MSAHLLLATLVTVPATTLVAVGVLGVLGAGLRRRAAPAGRVTAPQPSGNAPIAPNPATVARACDLDSSEDSPRAAAYRALDGWACRPRAAWRTLGDLEAHRGGDSGRARDVAALILDGVIAHRAEPFDAWLVRDLAQTAWQMAPDDGTVLSPAIEAAARRAVESAALALLVRDWMPAEDLALLTGAVEQ